MPTNLPDMYQFVIRVTIIEASGNRYIFNHDVNRSDSIEIHFNVDFSDDPDPKFNTIDLFNINNDSINCIQRGATCILEAGYGSDVGVVSRGLINRVYKQTGDFTSSGDIQTTFTFKEGVDYTNYKFKPKSQTSFPNNTRADVILNRVAQQAGIPLKVMKLNNNKLYNKGYTVDGDPMSALQDVAEACNSSLYHVFGQAVVNDIKSSSYTGLFLSPTTGLIGFPQDIQDENSSGYSLTCLLEYRINVASSVMIGSPYVNGQYHVKNGSHSYDGTSATTTLEVV